MTPDTYDLRALAVELPPCECHCAPECVHLREAWRRGYTEGLREHQEPPVLVTLNLGRLFAGAVALAAVTAAVWRWLG